MSTHNDSSCSRVGHRATSFQTQQLEDVKREEYELLENQSIPLRNYLMKHVMPTLTKGLIDSCKVRPDDPIDYLVRAPFHLFFVVTGFRRVQGSEMLVFSG